MKDKIRGILAVETLINALANALLNALCAWILHLGAAEVRLPYGFVAADTVITCVFVCMLTVLCNTLSVRRYRRLGVSYNAPARVLKRLPRAMFPLGLLCSVISAVLIAPLLCAALALLCVQSLPLYGYVLLKALWAGALGAVVANITLRRGLIEE